MLSGIESEGTLNTKKTELETETLARFPTLNPVTCEPGVVMHPGSRR